MTKNSLWTVIGVIVAVVIAWWLVGVLFSLLWFIAKLAIVRNIGKHAHIGCRHGAKGNACEKHGGDGGLAAPRGNGVKYEGECQGADESGERQRI